MRSANITLKHLTTRILVWSTSIKIAEYFLILVSDGLVKEAKNYIEVMEEDLLSKLKSQEKEEISAEKKDIEAKKSFEPSKLIEIKEKIHHLDQGYAQRDSKYKELKASNEFLENKLEVLTNKNKERYMYV